MELAEEPRWDDVLPFEPGAAVYAITRLKAALSAWYWAVKFKRRGKLYSKRFYDLKHGGSKKCAGSTFP